MLPVQILKDNAQEERGETARLSSFVGAIAIGDLVKSTLGPKGMDKILISGSGEHQGIKVTNDGATILKSIGVDNPAAKVLVDMSMTQDSEVGDGTTSVTVLAAELLREAEKLVNQRIHPQTIIAGYRRALLIAQDALRSSAMESGKNMEEDLLKIARTTLGSKILNQHKDHFAKLAVDAVLRMKVKVFGSRVRVESVAKVAELEAAEKLKMKEKVDKILAHKINVFINRQLIYNYPEQLFADANVMAIEHADFEGIERLALVLGEACSIVLRGATQQILEEAERSLHDALCVLITHVKESKTVAGAGASEVLMSTAVGMESHKVAGKEALAVEAFARALSQLPTIICDNAGLDSADIVTRLRAEHANGHHNMGIDIVNGTITDVVKLGVIESFNVKLCMVSSAAEAAEQILRVDNIIKCAPRARPADHRPC
ncbi:T-complex protein 1, beta subunit [Teladorsagia circumcincta]|uniref:T-complex protein 1, beta subunit n=1 Tax=Teladorsagia circumcincta TaxID=45464 RepID=A0A2G9UZS8_TELCI|nr:T-complex protein 1, beta subunit [Teladorsagia circumcincta]